jgi:hypothetical protein
MELILKALSNTIKGKYVKESQCRWKKDDESTIFSLLQIHREILYSSSHLYTTFSKVVPAESTDHYENESPVINAVPKFLA